MSGPAPLPGLEAARTVYPVAEYVRRTAGYLDRLPAIWVDGEVRELKAQPGWASVFFTLADRESGASLQCSIPRPGWLRSPSVEEGMRVHVHGRGQLQSRRGQFVFQAVRIEPYGIGRLLAELEERRRRLDAEGLFAPGRKRPLPFLPATIGIVCGRGADAERDVVINVRKRLPSARFRIEYALVQGPSSPLQVRRALALLDADPAVDVIVVTRGGGSAEDLAGFSDEALCRAIAASGTPVVSAIGHERDAPICDLVADLRASTPTDAAKCVVPDARVVAVDLRALAVRSRRVVERGVRQGVESLRPVAATSIGHPDRLVGDRRADLAALRGRHLRCSPERRLEERAADLRSLRRRLRAGAVNDVAARRLALDGDRGRLDRCDPAARLPGLSGLLEEARRRGESCLQRGLDGRREQLEAVVRHGRSVSPRAVLDRGYAIVSRPEGRIVSAAAALAPGDPITIRFASGRAGATVTSREADDER
jgi:exodeoxyribonuclease VII large subunit